MAQLHDGKQNVRTLSSRRLSIVAWALNSYASVLCLFVLDYIAASLARGFWGTILIAFLLNVTLLLALHISHVRRIWIILAVLFLIVSMISAVVAALLPNTTVLNKSVLGMGGVLLLFAPLVIARHIATHTTVTGETILGAICVYLLYGMSFAFVFILVGVTSPGSFFGTGQQGNTTSTYLFFSYTTLTTVGYGNLVPATQLGQTLAMLEALSGQIFLVIVVARLVALWGRRNPKAEARQRKAAGQEASAPGPEQQADTSLSPTPMSDQNR
jgi:voltage-gated potassium channel Kch